jgi:hypothetical protein
MIRHLFLLALLCLPLSAQSVDRGETRAYFGLMGVSEKRVGYSLAMTLLKVGPTRSGFHIGYIGRLESDEKTPANMSYAEKQPGLLTMTTKRQGYQVGYFADLARGFFAVGYEADMTTQARWSISPTKDVTSLPEVSTRKSGAYAQAGFRGKIFGAFVHYGSTTGFGAGVTVHFSLMP